MRTTDLRQQPLVHSEGWRERNRATERRLEEVAFPAGGPACIKERRRK